MIYKRYELSQSLNGDKLVQIARNAAGVVVFREESEKKLKQAIDNYLKQEQAAAEEALKKKLAKAAKTAKPAPSRLTKTQDGKFIAKGSLEKSATETEKSEPARKKTFWS